MPKAKARGGVSKDDDAEGEAYKIKVAPFDEDRGLYVIESDSDDITGQAFRIKVAQADDAEDAGGQGLRWKVHGAG